MIIHDVEQNSPEWYEARAGIPTASEFNKILTSTGKPSTQAEAYANKLAAERLTGQPCKDFEGSAYTERGHEFEGEAANFYAFDKDAEPLQVGFVTDDQKQYGCSPDRLIGEEGILEIKCPSAHVHVGYMRKQKIDSKYLVQCHGQLLVTGRKWIDWMSYHPDLKPVIIRLERDEGFLSSLAGALENFNNKINAIVEELKQKGA